MEIRRCARCHRLPPDAAAVRCPDCDAPLELADERSLLGERLGSYRLIDVIGEGGMGVVFRAEHERLGRPAAIKVLQPTRGGETHAKRFLREAKLVAALSHPNVIAVYDYDTTAWGLPYLVMELLDGLALADLAAAAPRGLPPATVAAIVADVVAGLGAAHAAGIIHRDLKPQNVFIAREGGRAVAKLLDFGIAKPMAPSGETSLTASAAVIGTPLYLAPEQLRGDPISPATDQYALALMVCELLTGVPVRRGRSLSEIISLDIAGPLPVEHLSPAPPKHASRALARATEPDPRRRFADLESFRQALGLPDEAAGRADLLARLTTPAVRATVAATRPASDLPAAVLERPTLAAGLTAAPTAPLAQAAALRARRRRRRWWGGLAALAAVTLAAGIGLWATRRPDPLTGRRPTVLRSWSVPAHVRAVLTETDEQVVLAGAREWLLVPRTGGEPTRVPWPAGDAILGAGSNHLLFVRRGGDVLGIDPVDQRIRATSGALPPELDAAPPDQLRLAPGGHHLIHETAEAVVVYRLDGGGVHRITSVASRRRPPLRRVVALDDHLLAVVEGDAELQLVDLDDGTLRWRQPFTDHQPRALALLDGLPYLAIGGVFDGVRLVRLADGSPGPSLDGIGNVGALAWMPDHPTLLVCGTDGLFAWPPPAPSVPAGASVPAPERLAVDGDCTDVRVGQSSLLALAHRRDQSVATLSELPLGDPLPARRLDLGTAEAWDLAFDAGGETVLVASADGTLVSVPASDDHLTARRIHEQGVTALAVRGEEVASASDDHTLALWSLPTLELRYRSRAHGYLINALAVTADGLWSSSSDRRLKRWSWPALEPQEEITLEELTGQPVELHALWAAADGGQLVIGTWGQMVVSLTRNAVERMPARTVPGPRAKTTAGAPTATSWMVDRRPIPSQTGYRFLELPGISALALLGLTPPGLWLFDLEDGRVDLARAIELPTFGRIAYALAPGVDEGSSLWLAGIGSIVHLGLERLPDGSVRFTAHAFLDGELGSTAAAARPGLLALATNDSRLWRVDPDTLLAERPALAAGVAAPSAPPAGDRRPR